MRRAYQMHITGAIADMELDWRKEAKSGVGAGRFFIYFLRFFCLFPTFKSDSACPVPGVEWRTTLP